MKKLSQDIIGKIKKEHIQQKAEYIFIVKNIFFTIFFLFSLLLGAIAFSLITYAIFEIDFELFSSPMVPRFQYLLSVVPLFWLISLLLFLILANFSAKHIKKGYKIPLWMLVVFNIIGSIVLGLILYFSGGADFLDQKTSLGFHRHQQMIKLWNRPEEGFLSGKMTKIDDNTFFLVEDRNEEIWRVDGASLSGVFWKEVHQKYMNEQIKILGEISGEHLFRAERVLPWKRGRGRGMRKGGQKMHSQGIRKNLKDQRISE